MSKYDFILRQVLLLKASDQSQVRLFYVACTSKSHGQDDRQRALKSPRIDIVPIAWVNKEYEQRKD